MQGEMLLPEEQRKVIREELPKLLEQGVIQECKRKDLKVTCPMFAVIKPNKNGKFIFKTLPADRSAQLVKFEVEDQELVEGRFGFLVNDNNGLFIDDFKVKGLVCTKEIEKNGKGIHEVKYLPTESNRYREVYFGIFESM